MTPNEVTLDVSRDHRSWATNDRNHVMVSNPNKMILIVAPSEENECLCTRTMSC